MGSVLLQVRDGKKIGYFFYLFFPPLPSLTLAFDSLRGNEFFAEVDEEYIRDNFNLTGLNSLVPDFEHALDVLLDADPSGAPEEHRERIEDAAELLYGLIHARYILTSPGLAAMGEKMRSGVFGRCPRVLCNQQPCLPIGLKEAPRLDTVKVFCPRCQDVYEPRKVYHATIDGAYFGPTFPHLLLQTYPELMPEPAVHSYVPRIYGFKIHRSAATFRKAVHGGGGGAHDPAPAGSSTQAPPASAAPPAQDASRH